MREEFKEAFKRFIASYEPIIEVNTGNFKRRIFYTKRLNTQKCRFCNTDSSLLTFKSESHLIPRFLGSKYLLSSYECDDCNSYFKKYENDLANFIGPIRSISGITGNSKIPKYSKKDLQIFHDPEEKIMIVSKDFVDKIEKGDRQIQIDIIKDRFTPINVYKALLKIALSILPENDIIHLARAFHFLKNDNEEFRKLKDSMNIFKIFVPGPSIPEYPIIHIFKRKNELVEVPQLVMILHIKNIKFQLMLPFNDFDNHLIGKSLEVPMCPIILREDFVNRFGDFQFECLDLSSTEIIINRPETIGLHLTNVTWNKSEDNAI